jgi:hypothetical protein
MIQMDREHGLMVREHQTIDFTVRIIFFIIITKMSRKPVRATQDNVLAELNSKSRVKYINVSGKKNAGKKSQMIATKPKDKPIYINNLNMDTEIAEEIKRNSAEIKSEKRKSVEITESKEEKRKSAEIKNEKRKSVEIKNEKRKSAEIKDSKSEKRKSVEIKKDGEIKEDKDNKSEKRKSKEIKKDSKDSEEKIMSDEDYIKEQTIGYFVVPVDKYPCVEIGDKIAYLRNDNNKFSHGGYIWEINNLRGQAEKKFFRVGFSPNRRGNSFIVMWEKIKVLWKRANVEIDILRKAFNFESSTIGDIVEFIYLQYGEEFREFMKLKSQERKIKDQENATDVISRIT